MDRDITKITKYVRLKENHPTMIKLNKVINLLDDLEMSFDLEPTDRNLFFSDGEKDFEIQDIEDNHGIYTFPPTTEFVVLTLNPEYVKKQREKEEQRKKQREAHEAKLKEEEKARLERIKLECEKEELERQEKLKASELEMLKTLYNKYPNALKEI